MSDGQGHNDYSNTTSTTRSNRSYEDDEFLTAVEMYAPASTREVADEVGCTFRTARTRLERLEAAERIRRKDFDQLTVWLATE
ncbi:FaeA/PapI family transcriptional regulator [Haloferax sulfurifontis]|uniref:Hth domain-containing protein n=2 Tax=Haloferax sulfurifontis TaxID=255616 RepID=M0IMC2_9EURY|nr:FaeA/PapI family transcriptional regulator [Haloferax sulfurifontis]ELZ96604.1 hypothetical protein C441_04529 [Haloferax sulfurifontis ATCC BAA-897]GGC72538.1 hypothetical protein GCM10007209_38100 [Haloferax sulfurifontis]